MKILDAFKLASDLSRGQLDKAGHPYIEHAVRVFLRVSERGGDIFQQIAALLHDCIEDGKATSDQLLDAGVPREAVALVMILTKAKGQTYASYVLGVKANEKAVLVKLCDLDDNSDPERLAMLDAATADRLRTKYDQARALLVA